MGVKLARRDEVRVGFHVLYGGSPTAQEIGNLRLAAAGHVLMHHHPGVVTSDEDPGHVMVRWLGLEEQDASLIVGHNPVGDEYPSLLVASAKEWEAEARRGWRTERKARRARPVLQGPRPAWP